MFMLPVSLVFQCSLEIHYTNTDHVINLQTVKTLFQNIFIFALKYKRHSSPSLYSCLFIWE